MNTKRLAYYDSLSDRELVAKLLANDKETIEYVFFYLCDGIFTYIVNTVFKSQGKKEELITDFYFHLSDNDWSRLRKFEFKAKLTTWMSAVASRFFRKKRASQTKLVPIDPQLIVAVLMNEPDDFDLFNKISKDELMDAIDHLSNPREKQAIRLALTGKSAEEIAVEMDCTVSAVYNLIKKAKIELKTLLKDKES